MTTPAAFARQIAHDLLCNQARISTSDLVRCLRHFGIRARVVSDRGGPYLEMPDVLDDSLPFRRRIKLQFDGVWADVAARLLMEWAAAYEPPAEEGQVAATPVPVRARRTRQPGGTNSEKKANVCWSGSDEVPHLVEWNPTLGKRARDTQTPQGAGYGNTVEE